MSQPDLDPLSPDAPIVQLLSLRHNKSLKDMSTEELTAYLERVQKLAQSPPTLTAALAREASGKTRAPSTSKAAVRKNILDNL